MKRYVGIDPGFHGAIGVVAQNGTVDGVWDLPTTGSGRARDFDVPAIDSLLCRLEAGYDDVQVGLEWPTTRPGEGAERSARFGRGLGILEALLHVRFGSRWKKVAPNLWKGRLGVPGKMNPDASKLARRLFTTYYPQDEHRILGPRGGLLDGRCDALLISHWMRMESVDGIRAVVDTFGRDSLQAHAAMLAGGRQRRPRMKTPKETP